MNAARVKWLALLAACWATTYALSWYHLNSVREYATSAQVYWRADEGVITLTTRTEVRHETLIARALRAVATLAGRSEPPEVRVGSAKVFTFRHGTWDVQTLDPARSPSAFPLWPYQGKFYTWDNLFVQGWNGHRLVPTEVGRAIELRQAFSRDANHYLPAGPNGSGKPYAVIQDPITLDEWHAYQSITSLPNGSHLAFTLGDKTFQISVQRGGVPADVSLTLSGEGKSWQIWQAQAAPRRVSGDEAARYLSGMPFGSWELRNQRARVGYAAVEILVVFLVLWGIFLKPMLRSASPGKLQFADADESEFPKLDRQKWNDLNARIETLGFVTVRTVKITNHLFKGISRVFLHPESNCYASTFQVFAPKAPPLAYGFTSYLEGDWSVGHGINKPQPGNAITRNKHKLSFSRPGTSPEQLYWQHLATRDRIAHDLGLAVVVPQGFETYQERSDMDMRANREGIARTNPILLALKVYRAKLKPLLQDWLGDYPKEMEARTGQKPVLGEAFAKA